MRRDPGSSSIRDARGCPDASSIRRTLEMRAVADPAHLDRMFFALADVHRRGMLDRLSRGPASVSELAQPLGIALPSAVKHLAVLEQGGFVASRKEGRVRTYIAEPK